MFFIIFGTKGIISRSKDTDVLEGACPQCSNNLVLSDLKKWFTLFFLPVLPYNTVDTFYYCKECKSSYRKEARSQLLGGKEAQLQAQAETLKFFGKALTACLSYMAKIDGEITEKEDETIKAIMSKFKNNAGELNEIYSKIKNGAYVKEDVYLILRQASEILTKEGILMLIAELARLMKVDGRIDKEEERLMKKFMLICGLSEDLYRTVLENV